MSFTVFDLVAKLTLDTSEYSSNLGDAKKGMSDAETAWGKAASSMSKAGDTLTQKVSKPLFGIGKDILQAGMDYEAGMSEVQAISGATGEDIAVLGDKAMEMAKKTKFSTGESAEAYKYMAMAGWKTKDMVAALDAVMYLAGASAEGLGTTSDIVTDAMTAFGMAADETSKVLKNGVEVEVPNATRFTDVLAAASNNANTNVAMLGESFKYVAPIAGSMGYKIEDVAIALGLMANSGVKASMGGTSLRTILTNLSDPTDELRALMDEMGISLDDGHGKMLSLQQIMDKLRSSFGNIKMPMEEFNQKMLENDAAFEAGNITESEYLETQDKLMEKAYGAEGAMKAQAASLLAGKTGMSGLMAIINATEEDYGKLTTAIYNSNGATQAMYETMNNNATGSVTMLDSAINVLYTSLSQHMIPIFTDLVKKLTDVVNWFNELSPGTQKFIVEIGAAAIAIGPLLKGIGDVIGIGVKLSGFFSAATAGTTAATAATTAATGATAAAGAGLTAVLGPIALVVAAIAGIILIVKNWDEIMANIKATLGEFMASVNDLKKDLGNFGKDVKKIFTDMWSNIKSESKRIWGDIKTNLKNGIDSIKGLFNVSKFLELGKNITEGIKKGIAQGARNIVDAAKNAAKSALDSAKKALGIASPSKEFAWVGRMIDEGMAGGIEGSTGKVLDAVDSLAGITEQPFEFMSYTPAVAGVNGAYGGDELNSIGGIVKALEGMTLIVNIGQERLEAMVAQAIQRRDYRSGGR